MNRDKPTLGIILPPDRRGRRRMCRVAAKLHKSKIEAAPNGAFAVSVWLSPLNQITLFADTRLQVSRGLDHLFDLVADPSTAAEIYRYLHSLNARAETGNLVMAADMFTPDGKVTNLDAAGTA